MKNAIILHGKPDKDEYYDANIPSASNHHWIPWLQNQLVVRDIAAHTPEIPNAWKPDYETWRREFERFEVTPETILVGHSCGAGFLVRWLSEHTDIHAGKVVLVAPWLDPDRKHTTDFFEFTTDPNLAARTKRLMIFSSDNDLEGVQKSVKILTDTLKDVKIRLFHNFGHFTPGSKNPDFPELLEECLK